MNGCFLLSCWLFYVSFRRCLIKRKLTKPTRTSSSVLLSFLARCLKMKKEITMEEFCHIKGCLRQGHAANFQNSFKSLLTSQLVSFFYNKVKSDQRSYEICKAFDRRLVLSYRYVHNSLSRHYIVVERCWWSILVPFINSSILNLTKKYRPHKINVRKIAITHPSCLLFPLLWVCVVMTEGTDYITEHLKSRMSSRNLYLTV